MRDNSQLYCTVHYTYSEEVSETMKALIEKIFMILRSEAVDLLNPHYEEWNNEYDKEVTGEDDMEYNGFIQKKQIEILDKVNKKYWFLPLKLSSDEYADIIGVFEDKGKNVIMHMSIKLINENEYKEYWKTHKEIEAQPLSFFRVEILLYNELNNN